MKENNENQASAVELNLQELMLLYLRKWWAIAICCVLGAAMMFTYTKLFVTPMYRSSVSFYINNSSETNFEYLSSSDLSASSWLVNGYTDMVRRYRVLDVAAADVTLGGKYTAGQIRGMVSTRKTENTPIFQVYVTNSDPKEAAKIANAIAAAVPDAAKEVIKGSTATLIDKARIPSAPISPSYPRSIMIGGMLGFLVAVAILTIRFLRDTRIRDEEELLMLFDLPVLGRIPDFEQEGVTNSYEYVKKPAAKEAN